MREIRGLLLRPRRASRESLPPNPVSDTLWTLCIHSTSLNQLSMMTNKDKNVNLEIQWPIIDFIGWTHHDHRELIGQSNYIKNQLLIWPELISFPDPVLSKMRPMKNITYRTSQINQKVNKSFYIFKFFIGLIFIKHWKVRRDFQKLLRIR